jgi:hypothetical protein
MPYNVHRNERYRTGVLWRKIAGRPFTVRYESSCFPKRKNLCPTLPTAACSGYLWSLLIGSDNGAGKEVRYKDKLARVGIPNTISILIGGAAGAGIDTLENFLCDAFQRSGYYLFSTKEYMSRVRGGSNTVLIRISDTPLEAPCWEVDLFIAMDALALEHAKNAAKTIILADQTF